MITSGRICEITGALSSQVSYWIRQGYLNGLVERIGRTSTWVLPPEEGRVAVRLGHLVVAGIPPAVAATTARFMVNRKTDTIPLSPMVTVTVLGADNDL